MEADIEEHFFRLMKDGVYSKARENVRNRIDVKFVSNKQAYLS